MESAGTTYRRKPFYLEIAFNIIAFAAIYIAVIRMVRTIASACPYKSDAYRGSVAENFFP